MGFEIDGCLTKNSGQAGNPDNDKHTPFFLTKIILGTKEFHCKRPVSR
jgi:hypothetical protein